MMGRLRDQLTKMSLLKRPEAQTDKGEIALALLKELVVLMAQRGLLTKSDGRDLTADHQRAAAEAGASDITAELSEFQNLIEEHATS